MASRDQVVSREALVALGVPNLPEVVELVTYQFNTTTATMTDRIVQFPVGTRYYKVLPHTTARRDWIPRCKDPLQLVRISHLPTSCSDNQD